MEQVLPGKTPAVFTPRPIIETPNGNVRKYLNSDNHEPKLYQEVYFSNLLPLKCKKWKCNKRQAQNITVVLGRVAVICISRESDGFVYEEFLIDEKENFGVLEIPVGVIYGLFADAQGAVIVNSLAKTFSDNDAEVISQNFEITPKLL